MKIKFLRKLALPKIRQQIIVLFLLSSIVPICIFGIFAIVNARNEMLRQSKIQIESKAIHVNSTLFDITTSVITSTSNISDSSEYRGLFNHEYTKKDQERYSYLDTYMRNYRNNTASVSSIHIYTDNPTIPTNDYISYMQNVSSSVWAQQLDSGAYSTWYCVPSIDRFNHTLYELTLVQRIPLVNCPYSAYLVTCLDSNYLRNRLLTDDRLIIASIDENPIFFSSKRSLIWQDMPFTENQENKIYHFNGAMEIDGETMLTSVVTFLPYKTQNHFYICASDGKAYKNINKITHSYLLILLFATLLPTGVILLFSSYFSGRIQILKRAMHQASLGDYNIIDHFNGDDELTETFQDLKTTVDKIYQKEAKFYESQISEKELINAQQQMEFKMLASQINPHFLYNTLETIRMQSLSAGNRNVANSIHLLGKTMHYVLENTGTDSTNLAKELDHVITYLKIQQLRFADRVNYQIQTPPYLDLTQIRILPLLLQPIVENAIVHGLEGVTKNGQIIINVILEEPCLYITIEDNGEGMNKEALNKLKKHISADRPDSNTSIGLRNIDHRLRLMYGEEYALQFFSRENSGTTITLTFPLEQILDKDSLNDVQLRRQQYLDSISDI